MATLPHVRVPLQSYVDLSAICGVLLKVLVLIPTGRWGAMPCSFLKSGISLPPDTDYSDISWMVSLKESNYKCSEARYTIGSCFYIFILHMDDVFHVILCNDQISTLNAWSY